MSSRPLVAIVAAALLAGCAHSGSAPAARTREVAELDAAHQPLRALFDADAAHPRLLVLASPT
ncbi:MAG: hypothetical protein EXR72_14655 [Myxococcales bacterium]|nr:hypothetical protein [Myxococcales bacterium]